jgi:prepilin-type processing-associated H-X9-DG protein
MPPSSPGARDSNDVAIKAGNPPTVAVLKNGDRLGNVAFCDGHAAAIDRASAHSKDHWAPDAALIQGYP